MSLQLSTAVRNAQLDAIAAASGAGARLRFYTGAKPNNSAAAANGTLLCDVHLPATWMSAALGAFADKAGIWTAQCGAPGTIGHWRLYDATLTTCHLQGSASASGGNGDIELDNLVVVAGQSVIVNVFTLTAANG